MSRIHDTKLELLRSGPEHNQLLSPLTPYLALCGPGGAQTLHLPFEHDELIRRLARLKYVDGGKDISDAQREGELGDIGVKMGRLFGQVPGLQSAFDAVPRNESGLIHVRLALSGLELAMLPFEAAIAPDNLPGSGQPMLLGTPVVFTREVRRRHRIEVQWNRKPRILFAFATPPGLQPVPAQAHLLALRKALTPFVAIRDSAEERAAEVGQLLTVLPEATLMQIAEACGRGEYTHVHLLAHGAPYDKAGNRAFGIALNASTEGRTDIVSGERLANALRGLGMAGAIGVPPTVVTLATCDSGGIGNVIAPGGSIAHELHAAGVPWVIASQFPLYMSASTLMVETLYTGLLLGRDPRHVLYRLRNRLHTEVAHTHDWASIVAYAISPFDFEGDIAAFYDKQMRRRLDVLIRRMDELAQRQAEEQAVDADGRLACEAELKRHAAAVRALHREWIAHVDAGKSEAARAEARGMQGAGEKRIAIAYGRFARAAQKVNQAALAEDAQAQAREAYLAARSAYEAAIKIEPTNDWVITQFVSISVLPELMPDARAHAQVRESLASWWTAARQIASWKLERASGNDRAWAFGTLVELDMLACVFDRRPRPSRIIEQVQRDAEQLVAALGDDRFPLQSTATQIERYLNDWQHPRWQAAASEIKKISDAAKR
jgi:hypothetical protein